LKQFELHLNQFEFETKSDLNPVACYCCQAYRTATGLPCSDRPRGMAALCPSASGRCRLGRRPPVGAGHTPLSALACRVAPPRPPPPRAWFKTGTTRRRPPFLPLPHFFSSLRKQGRAPPPLLVQPPVLEQAKTCRIAATPMLFFPLHGESHHRSVFLQLEPPLTSLSLARSCKSTPSRRRLPWELPAVGAPPLLRHRDASPTMTPFQ
jgi:hypothetical protein